MVFYGFLQPETSWNISSFSSSLGCIVATSSHVISLTLTWAWLALRLGCFDKKEDILFYRFYTQLPSRESAERNKCGEARSPKWSGNGWTSPNPSNAVAPGAAQQSAVQLKYHLEKDGYPDGTWPCPIWLVIWAVPEETVWSSRVRPLGDSLKVNWKDRRGWVSSRSGTFCINHLSSCGAANPVFDAGLSNRHFSHTQQSWSWKLRSGTNCQSESTLSLHDNLP